jgi:DNA/RNA-binding domain of Phe-tRNA-synthetase-like protein
MNDIVIEISDAVLTRFPGIRCGGFAAANLPRDEATLGSLAPDSDRIRAALASDGVNLETITQDDRIASWRTAIQGSGLKAAKVRGSAEQLARRYLRGDRIGGPGLVRSYCAFSALFVAPLGGYDVDRLPSRRIDLRHARTDDTFDPLGGDPSSMPLLPTVPVYAAGHVLLCWMLNVRDSATTALTDATSHALFLTEALTPTQANASTQAIEALRDHLHRAGADVGPIAWNDARGQVVIAAT